MRTDTPQTIYRKDYTPPGYLVDTVELGFDLDPARTIVASRLTMHRTPASAQREIELYGENIELVALRMNGKTLGIIGLGRIGTRIAKRARVRPQSAPPDRNPRTYRDP